MLTILLPICLVSSVLKNAQNLNQTYERHTHFTYLHLLLALKMLLRIKSFEYILLMRIMYTFTPSVNLYGTLIKQALFSIFFLFGPNNHEVFKQS